MNCFLQPAKGVHLLLPEGNSLPHPIGPLNSFQTSLDLPNLSSSSQSKLRVQKDPWPISVNAEEYCIFPAPDESILSST